jgi:hypothetical protein
MNTGDRGRLSPDCRGGVLAPPARRGLKPAAYKRPVAATIVLLLAFSLPARAEQRFALIISGAAGNPQYAEQYSQWATNLQTILIERMKLARPRLTVLRDGAGAENAATAVNVRRTLGAIRKSMVRGDLLLIVLIGHGTFDGMDAKFNLVGPDLESAEWAGLIEGLPGQVVFVNTASASFPFLERLAGPRRIVISATDTIAQRFDTVFAEYFIKALQGDAGDLDKNDRISMWEAFAAATDGVRRHYQQRGQLATERGLLDDSGDGVGHDATGSSDDGSAASRIYLDEALPGAAPTDEVLLQLLQKRAALETEADELKIRRSFLPPAEYQKEFERIMIELARVARDIRQRVKS